MPESIIFVSNLKKSLTILVVFAPGFGAKQSDCRKTETLALNFPDILQFQWEGQEWRRKGTARYHSRHITASVSARKLSLKE